jgi:hypothetical protein
VSPYVSQEPNSVVLVLAWGVVFLFLGLWGLSSLDRILRSLGVISVTLAVVAILLSYHLHQRHVRRDTRQFE